MTVLGLCDGHGAGAALVRAGELLAAVSEERLTRRKRARGFPRRAIEACLAEAGVDASSVRRVVLASRFGRAGPRLLDERYREGREGGAPWRLEARLMSGLEGVLARTPGLRDLEEAVGTRAFAARLAALGLRVPVETCLHHRAHAVGALGAARASRAAEPAERPGATQLVVTLDGYGDGLAGTISLVDATADGAVRLELVEALPWTESLGVVYGVVAALLGFAEGDEGQVTALAAAGDPHRFAATFRALLRIPGEGRARRAFSVNRGLLHGPLKRALGGWERADIARALQERIEAAARAWVASAIEGLVARGRIPADRPVALACAGGLFANVRLGPALLELPAVEEVFVYPAMGDEGLCVGAALVGAGPSSRLPASFAFGPGIDATRVPDVLAASGLESRPLAGALGEIAEDLAAGRVVAVARGRMEFGPRALGGRSVLFDARRGELTERVSAALGRPRIMPFAPAIRATDLPDLVEGLEGLAHAASYMTVALPARASLAARFPAAVHTDSSARVQRVTSERAPFLAELLDAVAPRVGAGLLVNTSFNRHGEPIVASAEDAVETFLATGLDGLVLGDRWVSRSRPGG